MPTPGWLTYAELPTNSAGKRIVKIDPMQQILDQFPNWRGDVNGAGHNLTGLGNLGLSGSLTHSGNALSLVNSNTNGFVSLNAGTGFNVGGPSLIMRGSTSTTNPSDVELYTAGVLRIHVDGPTGSIGFGVSPNTTYAVHIKRPSGIVQLLLESLTDNDNGWRIKDASREYIWGINPGGVGVGRMCLFNITAGIPMFCTDDTSVYIWVSGALRQITRDVNGFLKG